MTTEMGKLQPKTTGTQPSRPSPNPPSISQRRVMDSAIDMLKKRDYKQFWQEYCGFIDLKLEEVMDIQKRLLLEQLEVLRNCELGRVLMRGAMPRSVEEFRRTVPLTTYKDYAPYLLKQKVDVLPTPPLLWGHTSGRTGEYDLKWCPITSRQWEEVEKILMVVFTLCSCTKRGEVNIRLHDKILYGAAPAPYITGLLARYCLSRIFDYIPPLDEAEAMSFQDRFKVGIGQALCDGMDFNLALPSVLVNIAERFGQRRGGKLKAFLQHPRMIPRIMRGVIRSKREHRPMLPKDVWSLKGLISGGSDASVYRDKIEKAWGRPPLDVLACTEGMLVAFQTWDYEDMTFYPLYSFFEFIPEEECNRAKTNPGYKPTALLLDEVQPGQNYQLVMTNFHGGPFIRYIVGDMIRITARRNEKLNIDIPQMVYHSRVDDMIDIAGFTRLTESVIWKAIEKSGIPYEDWAMRKELADKPVLHLYVELKAGKGMTADLVRDMVHHQLVKLDKPYSELESYIGLKPLQVTLIPQGAFMRYTLKQVAAGVELGRMKVSHLSPSDETVRFLLNAPPKVS